MDTVWRYIIELAQLIKAGLDYAFSPLNDLGPGFAIFVIALLTAAVTRVLNRTCTSKKYRRLEQEFHYWFHLKEAAVRAKEKEDPEKAKQLGREFDQGKLNQAYWDFFFEGLLNSLKNTYIPVLCMLVYVNRAYSPENMERMFGRSHVFDIGWLSGEPFQVHAVLWFVASLILSYILLFALERKYFKRSSPEPETDPTPR